MWHLYLGDSGTEWGARLLATGPVPKLAWAHCPCGPGPVPTSSEPRCPCRRLCLLFHNLGPCQGCVALHWVAGPTAQAPGPWEGCGGGSHAQHPAWLGPKAPTEMLFA